MQPRHYRNDEVVIDCLQVSQLDGKKGRVVGFERGYVAVQIDGFCNPILFAPEELKR